MKTNIMNEQSPLYKIFTVLMFVVSFVYFGVFRFFVVPSGDDYFWWGPSGTYLLHHMFYGPQATYGGSSNGRYIGNTLEIFTMHNLWLAILMYAIFWTLLLWGFWELSGPTFLSLVLSFLFVFTLQDGFLNNILVWNAGFINYVPPVAMILVYIWMVDTNKDKKPSRIIPLCTLILAYVIGLFTETLTIASIVLGVLVILYFNKKTKAFHITYLVGAIASAITMFMHPGYHEHNLYHTTTFNLSEIWLNYSKITHFWLITFNLALLVGLLLAIVLLAVQSDFSILKKISITLISLVFLAYYIGINIYLKQLKLNYMYGYTKFNTNLANIEGIISLLLVTFIGYCIFIFFKTDAKMWLYFLMTGVIMGQLLFVSAPINCRGNFETYVFMYLIAMRFVIAAAKNIKFRNLFTGLLSLTLIVVGAGYMNVMNTNYKVNSVRVQDPKFYTGKASVNRYVPYRKFIWVNDLKSQQAPAYWKEYFNIK
ncbi:hypothetical protein [Companilactobacillus ginsenosidimutans]|nr:hypothetical protein [Companilactobacillus ginsenosidimutans]